MEDKKLQELFAAKRTSEANRRRQEELRRMMEVESGKRKVESSRRLWPVWFGAAAAAVVLLLIALPTLFRQPESTPLLVAQADRFSPIAVEETIPEEAKPQPTPAVRHTRKTIHSGEIAKVEPIEQTLVVAEIPDITITQTEPTNTPIYTPSSPRVMRRTSGNLACEKGCARPSYNSQELAINLFPKDTITKSFALIIK